MLIIIIIMGINNPRPTSPKFKINTVINIMVLIMIIIMVIINQGLHVHFENKVRAKIE